ncbi:MAG: FtsW/RodA/SpoVE family cell cycle protein [Bacteroidales bacterium]|nr:FtsW/RodA/SpoVE family cell cycle protein [Bacteroidales bacterium]
MKKYFKGDLGIWAILFMLCVFSLLVVYSATGALAYRFAGGNTAYYILRHGILLCGGLGVAYFFHKISYRYYAGLSKLLIVVAPVLLVVTLLFGVDENEATRRISLFGITFQTSDFAKLALIMFLARWLAVNQERVFDFRKKVFPVFLLISVVCALILPANFSTAALLFVISMALLFVGRVAFKHILMLAGIAIVTISLTVGGIYGLHKAGAFDANRHLPTKRVITWVGRLSSFFGEDGETEKDSYQADQAKIAVGTVGLLGKGPGNSIQRNFLPHPYSDFVFAIIIEEWGDVIATVVLALYLALLFRTVQIVRKCERTFPAFLATGLSFSIVFQAMLNMMVAVGLFPITGQPLPMISMGGTSILATGVAFGIILGISREINEQEEKSARKIAAVQPVGHSNTSAEKTINTSKPTT